MVSPRYSQEMKEAIKQMVSEGKTQSQIAEHFGLKDRSVVHQLLKRERRKEKATFTLPKKRGRPLKYSQETIAELKAENQQLNMENELMKSFMEFLERR